MNKQKAINFLIGMFLLVLVFHLLVISGLIPYQIVWGGRLQTDQDMYRFEVVSILVNTFIILILWVKKNNLKNGLNQKWVNALLWFFCGLFILNTIGNLMAETLFEKLAFTPLTLIASILIFRILR